MLHFRLQHRWRSCSPMGAVLAVQEAILLSSLVLITPVSAFVDQALENVENFVTGTFEEISEQLFPGPAAKYKEILRKQWDAYAEAEMNESANGGGETGGKNKKGRTSGKKKKEANVNNWAVIVDTSRYFYNYRHASNALSFYHTVKARGVPDEQIILFLAEDYACSPRNVFPGRIFNDHTKLLNLYSGAAGSVEVDYRGDEVTVTNFLRLLQGQHAPFTPRNKRLGTNHESNLLIYMTGHSGASFLKFQDWEELQSQDLADALGVMYEQKRYGKVFWISDTCQAATLHGDLYTPQIVALGSSRVKENSYSHHIDHEVGVAMIDRFTHDSLDFFEKSLPTAASGKKRKKKEKRATIQDYVGSLRPEQMYSHAELRTDLIPGGEKLPLTDFLASSGSVQFVTTTIFMEKNGKKGASSRTGRRTRIGSSGGEGRVVFVEDYASAITDITAELRALEALEGRSLEKYKTGTTIVDIDDVAFDDSSLITTTALVGGTIGMTFFVAISATRKLSNQLDEFLFG